MKSALRILPALLALLFLGMAKKKSEITVRFYVEANAQDTDKFASPVKLLHPPRETYIEKVPAVSERHIKAIYPFHADDGTWGCAFKLDNLGRVNLEVLSTQRRGTSLIAVVSTVKGAHQVIDMIIDRPVTDGVITIQRGLTELEIAALAKEFPVLGQPKRK